MTPLEFFLIGLVGAGLVVAVFWITRETSFRRGLSQGNTEAESRFNPQLQAKDAELQKIQTELAVERGKVVTLTERLDNSVKYFSTQQKDFEKLQTEIKSLENENKSLRDDLAGYDCLKSDFELLRRRLDRERERGNHLSMMNITQEFRIAREAANDDRVPFLFISGGAGTGKSQFVKYVLDQNADDILFVAPTGIAARNINGLTIHSCFHFKTAPWATAESLPAHQYNQQRFDFLRNIRILVIDEISMVRADMLDLICVALMIARHDNRPFGGVKIVAVGDLYQLPPVVDEKMNPGLEKRFSEKENPVPWESWSSPRFFSAHCLKNMSIQYVEFTHQFRQKVSEREYAGMLNRLRVGCDRDMLQFFNRRVEFADADVPRVFPTNAAVDARNRQMLAGLSSPAFLFTGVCEGTFEGMKDPELPVPRKLELKVGAKVMFVKNGSHWKNGSMGVVTALTPTTVDVKCEDDGATYPVQNETWEDYQFDKRGKLYIAGTYSQIPLVPAWAFTVHKTQGLTFRRLAFDPSNTFDVGMVYVALSRTTSIGGLYLEQRLTVDHVRQDGDVKEFYENFKRRGIN
jgi:ATP-dependent exoDNAse (exonuclease V) alpha subunit